ncbi:MAG: NADH-quinone oxidoreductase subunit C [Cyanobacteria bacterium HKST-UBA04]|nr:NADH-quinone oxidoreductase subunit C [Cyanobacteria bacterium HKST-UBA04]
MKTKATPQTTQDLLAIFNDFFGDDLHSAEVVNPSEIHLLVDETMFYEGAAFIHSNLLFKSTFITLVATDERRLNNQFNLHGVFLLKAQKVVVTLITGLDGENPSYKALTPLIPAAEWLERELHDLFGIEAEGVDLKPLVLHRGWPKAHPYVMHKDVAKDTPIELTDTDHEFGFTSPASAHQVAVGPIHAGIIEPGHLRFCVTGERIHHFDAQLFYTHKGIEKMAEGKTIYEGLTLAEHVCGLCAFSHSLAYSQAVESLCQITPSERTQAIRRLLLEMERLANHFADLTAICSAGGFGFASARAAYFRESIMQLNKHLTGHRFLRDFNTLGGLKSDLQAATLDMAFETLDKLKSPYRQWVEMLYNKDSFLDRVEGAGLLGKQQALDLGIVGPSARGSGVVEDLRHDYPQGMGQPNYPTFSVPSQTDGDVRARMQVRIDEVYESLMLIRQTLSTMAQDGVDPAAPTKPLKPNPETPGIGLVESAKGGLLHWLVLEASAPVPTINRWHVRSASYMNWRGMAAATMGNNIVPDGPLVNKSFNLCYACSDR